MIRIAALNDSSSEDDSRAPKTPARRTKEAKESEAFTLYDAALRLQRQGEVDLAEAAFKDLLNHGFLRETAQLVEDEEEGADQDGLRLLYSIHKNLASMALHREDLQSAISSYVEAVKIDTTEVTVWYKIGTIALKLYNFPLARLGFEKGLHCNPNHWPCLDHVVTLLYAMNDYFNCMYYISRALEKDFEYTKGLAFRKQILKEHPSLKYDTDEMFEKCDPVVLLAKVDPTESEEYINEALDLRDRRRELAKEPEPLPIKLTKVITHFTWKNLGESLIELYDRAVHSDPPLSLGLHVDLSEYSNCTDLPPVQPDKSPTAEEASENSGEMEVDLVTMDTREKESVDCKKTESNTSEILDVPMTTDDPAAQTDKENVVAMETDDACDKMKSSSLMPSDSFAVLPSSPLPSAVSQISLTDSSVVTSDAVISSTLISEEMQVICSDKSVVQSSLSKSQELTGESEHPPVVYKEKQPVLSPTKVQQFSSAISEQLSQPTTPVSGVSLSSLPGQSNVLPQSYSAITSVSSSTSSKSNIETSGRTVSDMIMETEPTSETPYAKISGSSPMSSASQPSTVSSSSLSSGMSPMLESRLAPLSPPSVIAPTTPVSETPSSEIPPTTPISSIPHPTQIIGVPHSTPTSEMPHSTQISGMPQATSISEIPKPSAITGMPLSTSITGMPQSTSISGISKTSSIPGMLHTPVSGLLQTSPVSGMPQTSPVSGMPHTSPVSGMPQTLPVSGMPHTSPVSGMPHTSSVSGMPHTSPVSGMPHTSFVSGMPHTSPVSRMSHTSPVSGMPQTSPVSGMPHTSSVSGMPHTSSVSGMPHTSPVSGIPHTSPVSGMPHTSSVSGMSHTSSVSGVPHTPPVSAPISQPVNTPVTELSYTIPTMSTPVSPSSSPSVHKTSPITALHDHTCAAPVESEDLGKGRGKATKRKRGFIPEDFGLSVKRRSARVRNVSKPKEEPSVNFEELLISFLPSSLKQMNEDDEVLVVQEQEQSLIKDCEEKAAGGETELTTEVQKLITTEDTEVREFLKQSIKNAGTISLMMRYLFALAKHGEAKWTLGLTDIYLKVYSRTRKHFDLPDIFSLSDSEEYTQNLGKTCQLAAEFQLDQWIVNNRMAMSPGSSPRSPGSQQLHTSDLPSHCNDDLWFITGLTCCGEVMGSQWLPHCIRVYWMKSRFYMLQGKMDDALYCFQKTLEYLEYSKEQGEPTRICLVNCKMDRIISIDQVKSHQESLHRCQSLEETQKLYEAGNYEKVVDFILQTFTKPQLKGKTVAFSAAVPERQSQLILLQDSLFKMDAHKKGMVWGEVSFNEAVQCYRKAANMEQKAAWSDTLSQICQNLIRILDKKDCVLKEVPNTNLVRLSRNLISIIDITMAAPDSAVEMPIGTVLPWILLYKLIKFEEDKIRSMQLSTPADSGQADLLDGMPSYLMLLNIAHEYLARHSWCTRSNGSLLLFYLEVAQEFLSGSYQFKRDIEQSYEQCVYCLFGHPSKKGRARHLMDHNAAQIDLTWDSAQKIFEYFKPNSVPEFDSYKADAVSADVETLLKRIAQLVPESEKPAKVMENLQDYIEGNTNIPPTPDTKHLSTVSKELYYLLADYYFKNKEQAKAVRFYMSDICMNPTRLDSWAGMGLARMSQLEQKLSSISLKMDMPIYRKSIGALRCFRRAVEIDDTNAKLWIEYGSLAYQLHSHASRQLKWKNWFPLTDELEQIASDSRQEMLQTAYNCYKKASECESEENEEEWLQHYMMAKCLEKMRKPPKDYLDHYKKAAEYLYEENATFPKKIVYAYTTPHLAVESLEIFYRIHVSIMKILLKNKAILESEMKIFQHYITEAANSPFARCHEKRQQITSTLDSPVLPVGQTAKTGGRKPKVTPTDHTYSKQKNVVDSSSTDQATSDLNQVMTSKAGAMVTHREVKVIDSSNAAGSMMELSAENLDEHVTKTVEKEEFRPTTEKEEVNLNVTKETSSIPAEQGQGDKAVDDDMSEGEGLFLDEVTGIVKQASFGFDVKGDTVGKGDGAVSMAGPKDQTDDNDMEVCEGQSIDKAIDLFSSESSKSGDVSSLEDKLLAEDKPEGKRLDKNEDSLSDLAEVALLSSPGLDKIVQDKSLDNNSGPSKDGIVDGQDDEKSFHSDVRELSQGNESMESETRQYGDMNLPEDQDAGPPIDPSELSLSKGLRERMAKELEGDLMSKSGQSKEDLITKDKKGEKSVESLSDDDDNNDGLDSLSDSFDSIPDTAGSPSRSVADSLSKSGDSLSKSGGFLAQFNQFLSKNIIPDDIISESSPEKSLSSPMKVSRSQSPSSQNLTSDADTPQKVSSQQDTVGSISGKEELSPLSSNFSSKQSTQHGSTNQNLDNTDPKDEKIETTSANQCADKKTEPMEEIYITKETIKEEPAYKQQMECGQGDGNRNMEVDLSKDGNSGKKDGSELETSFIKRGVEDLGEDNEGNSTQNKEKTTESRITTSDAKMDITELDSKSNQRPTESNNKLDIIATVFTVHQGQKVDDGENLETSIKQEENTEEEGMDVSNVTLADNPGYNEKMDTDEKTDNQKKLADDTTTSKSVSEVKASDPKGITTSDGGKGKESSKEATNDVDSAEKKGVKKDKTTSESAKSKTNDKPGSSKMHRQLIEQCMAALCLCLARFPTHYKAMYRLAYTYVHSPYHKNLQYAHDLLLGNPDWKMMAHMPAPGLFVDRKPTNFFQGVWKIPVDEIDRSGSFPSHLTRSVKLLLKVLKDQKDVPKLHSIFLQLNRDPDSGKKYMRDAERVKFARLAHQYCLDAIRGRLPELRRSENHARAVKCLMEVYKVYNYISFKMDISQTIEANELLEDTFSAVMGKKVKDDEEVLEQAIRFCQEEVQRHKARQYQSPATKTLSDTSGKDGSQSDSSFFSPEKAVSISSKIGGQNQGGSTTMQGSKGLEKKGPGSSPFQQNYRSVLGSEMSTVKQTAMKPGNQGQLSASGVSKVIQRSSPSTQKPNLISTVKTNIPSEAKSKFLPTSGKGASSFKPYNPNDPSAPSPVTTPATPYIGLSPKFNYSKNSEPASSKPIQKVIEVIEISSSDDESDVKPTADKNRTVVPVAKGSSPVQKVVGQMQTGVDPAKKGENLRTLLQGGEYQSGPAGKGAAQVKGGNLPMQRPYPTGMVLNKGSKDIQGNQSKLLQKPVSVAGPQRGNVSTGHLFTQPQTQDHPGYVMYGAKTSAPSHHHKPSPSSQESITDDSDMSEKEDKTYEPSEESSSDEEQFSDSRRKGKLPVSPHSATRPQKYNVKAATSVKDIEPIRILNAETGQVVDSDSQKSDLVTDPEKLFFDVKDWLEDL
ncbi:uncharacterized protein [Argopecten irradians]|uniref:uncharacterized protein isoform X2 n=1 Tax=Argopecten irradians TaxID=31199 RepID=UPI00371B4D05